MCSFLALTGLDFKGFGPVNIEICSFLVVRLSQFGIFSLQSVVLVLVNFGCGVIRILWIVLKLYNFLTCLHKLIH